MKEFLCEGDIWRNKGTKIQIIGKIPVPNSDKNVLVQNLHTGLINQISPDELVLDNWSLIKGGSLNLSNMCWRILSENGTAEKATIEADGRGVGILDNFNIEMNIQSPFPILMLKFPVIGGLEVGVNKYTDSKVLTKKKEMEE